MTDTVDVVVIGAGIVGAAVACFAARAGLRVLVVDRGAIASGTSSRCEGNLLLSDKEVGPEFELARYSQSVWREDLGEHAEKWEFQAKGGLVVAASEASAATLRDLAVHQRGLGIEVVDVADNAALRTYEPALSPELVSGAYYPQDAQVQPVLAVHHLLALARAAGAEVRPHHPVDEILVSSGRVIGVRTRGEVVSAGAVINCAGPWSAEVARSAGVHLPVLPRRGFVLVTEPVPVTVHHKVYAAEYVGDVASGDAGLQVSPVVEGTPSGTILIGASRERVGFDETWALEPVARLARAATAMFPVLGGVNVLRTYSGFRPYCPDHLPAIGEDERMPGLWHATGHEGAGVGLSVGTAKLLVQALRGETPDIDLTAFRPARLDLVPAA